MSGRSSDTDGGRSKTGGRHAGRRIFAVVVLAVSSISAALGVSTLPAAAASAQVLDGWGYNAWGQLDNGSTTDALVPGPATLPAGVTPVTSAAGGNHSLAIGSNGSLYAWGLNGSGQLGNGTTTSSSTPVVVQLPTGVQAVQIAAGAQSSLALGSNGKLYAWGDNAFGELGDGNFTNSSVPVLVSIPAGATITAIAAGQYHDLAIDGSGKVYAWGYNVDGQLGNGSETTPSTPVKISLATGVRATAVAAGGYHSLAVGSDGNLYAWGDNSKGQLGNGTKTTSTTPTVVSLPAGVTATAIAAGLYHSLAIGSDGHLYAWGNNLYGQLGDGLSTNSPSPVVVSLPAGSTPSAISAGLYFSLALLPSGTLYSWGLNGDGQLGNGTTANSSSPVQVSVSANTTFSSLASDSSSSHSLAVAVPGPASTSTTLTPSVASPTYGQSETLTAVVSGSDGGGTVDFTDGSSTLAGCGAVALTPSGSNFQAQCTTSGLTAAVHNIGAAYSGDAAATGSSATTRAVTVTPAPLTISGSSSPATYGTAAPPVTALYTGFVNGDTSASLTTAPTCSTTATAASPVGTYATTCAGAVDPNYSVTYAQGEIVVSAATLSIAASSGTSVYGGAPPAVTPSYVGFVNGDTSASLTTAPTCSTTATAASPVGTYPTTCAGAVDANYTISYTPGQITVGAAPLHITASSVATTYGTAATAITPTYSGFLNGDTAASLDTQPSCSTTATISSPVGTYASTCAGASDPNYAISYVNGSVTVSPAPVTVTASSDSMTYGGGVPTIEPTVVGLENGEGASVLGAGLQCATTASATSAVGSYASTCSGASDPNYAITYVNGSVTVTPAPLTVTASSGSMTYGGNVPVISPTVTGLQNGEGPDVLGAGLTCSTTATPTSPVGSYPSNCSGVTDGNYAINYVAGTVTDSPAPLTITASSGSMSYGDSPPVITPSVSGLQNSDDVSVLGADLQCTSSALSSSPVGSYSSMCSGAVDTNYTVTYADGSVTVNPTPLTVTASSAAVTYGNAVPAITASYTGFVNGDTASSLATAPTCTSVATGSSPAGTYASSCSGAVDGNYEISYVPGAVVIGQAVLLVVASTGSMNYGDTPVTVAPTYLGFTNGDSAASLTTAPVCATAATSSSPVGTYANTCSGAVDPNYTISYVAGTETVAPTPLSITAGSGSISYGDATPNITPAYSGFVNGDTASSLVTQPSCSSPVLPTSPVGSYASSCSGAADPNYVISYVGGSVTVSPASITVTASSPSMVYGGTVPAITPSVSGLQNSESVSVLGAGLTCSTAATPTSAVGSYDSSCSGAVDPNYSVGYVDGSVQVTAAPLTITASSGSFAYGGSPPTITASVTGLQNGDTVADLGAGLTCSTTATATSPVASYPSTCSGAADPNYTSSYVPGTVQEVAAPLVVAASSGSMTYGGTPPTITPVYSGFVNGEQSGVLNSLPTCSTAATPNSPVGSYASTCSGASDPDYTVTYVPGTVVVGASALVISASSQSRTYGSAGPAITPTYSGFVNGDGPSSLSKAPTCATSAATSSPVGTYASTCSGAVDPNYTISYVPGSVHITAAPLSITASSATITYGSHAPAITPTASGFVNGDGISALGAGLACSTAAGATSPVGNYSSTCSGASDANYVITYAAGTVAVTPATLTVTANNQSMTFGSSVPALTATITGFVNGQTLATSGVTGTAACSTAATSMSPAGSYAITCLPGTLKATNYTFTFVAGTLTVSNTRTLACLTIGSVIVTAGQSVRINPGCTVIGSITVNAGGSLDSEGALVLGALVSNGGSVRICSTSLALLLTVTRATTPVVVGDGTSSCGGSTLIGGVGLTSDTGGVSLRQAAALGILVVSQDSGGVTVVNNCVVGDLTVTGNTGVVVDRPNSVVGSANLQ